MGGRGAYIALRYRNKYNLFWHRLCPDELFYASSGFRP